MAEGQFDGVTDLLDLRVEAADVRVGHVRHLGCEELLDVGTHDALQRVARALVDDHGVTGTQVPVPQGSGQGQQLLLAAFGPHEDPVEPHQFEHGGEGAGTGETVGGDRHHLVVDAYQLADREGGQVEGGGGGQSHVPAGHDGLELTGLGFPAHECREGQGRAVDLPELVLHGHELAPGGGQGTGEPLVLLLQRHDRAPHLLHACFGERLRHVGLPLLAPQP